MKRRRKHRKITISKGSPKSNKITMDVHMRQSTGAIIGDIHEPVIYDFPQEVKKKKKKEK